MRRLLLLSLCAACSGKTSIREDQFANTFASAVCSWEVRCDTIPDSSFCATNQTIRTPSGGTYDGEAASACVGDLDALPCPDEAGVALLGLRADCAGVYRGTDAAGATCMSDSDCASGLCNQADACTVGICDALAPVGEGEACTQDVACPKGDLCGSDGKCDPAPGAGQACAGFCAEGLICSVATGTCVAPVAKGGRCDQDVDSCDTGLNCDGTTCGSDVAVGGSCTFTVDCVPYAFCDSSTSKCVQKSAPGGPCQLDEDCLQGSCQPGGTCSPTTCM
jgi:hypothetical protein